MMDLIIILDKESNKRIVKKIKKLEDREAEVFLEKWQRFCCMRRDMVKCLDSTSVEECNYVIKLIYREFWLLGIRIP